MRPSLLRSLVMLGACGCSDTVGGLVDTVPSDRPDAFADLCLAPDAATACPATTAGDPWRLQFHRLAPVFACAGGGAREPSLATTPDGPVLAVTQDGVDGPEVVGYRLSPVGNPTGRAFEPVPRARSPRLGWSTVALARPRACFVGPPQWLADGQRRGARGRWRPRDDVAIARRDHCAQWLRLPRSVGARGGARRPARSCGLYPPAPLNVAAASLGPLRDRQTSRVQSPPSRAACLMASSPRRPRRWAPDAGGGRGVHGGPRRCR